MIQIDQDTSEFDLFKEQPNGPQNQRRATSPRGILLWATLASTLIVAGAVVADSAAFDPLPAEPTTQYVFHGEIEGESVAETWTWVGDVQPSQAAIEAIAANLTQNSGRTEENWVCSVPTDEDPPVPDFMPADAMICQSWNCPNGIDPSDDQNNRNCQHNYNWIPAAVDATSD